jgi:hypothetical protein
MRMHSLNDAFEVRVFHGTFSLSILLFSSFDFSIAATSGSYTARKDGKKIIKNRDPHTRQELHNGSD